MGILFRIENLWHSSIVDSSMEAVVVPSLIKQLVMGLSFPVSANLFYIIYTVKNSVNY